MKSGKIDKCLCPSCKNKLDGFTSVDHKSRPSEGDVTVCCYCSSVLTFGSNLILELAEADHLQKVDFINLGKAHKMAKAFRQIKR